MVRLLIYIQGHCMMQCICRGSCGPRTGISQEPQPSPPGRGKVDCRWVP